jgi:hypothetical protein
MTKLELVLFALVLFGCGFIVGKYPSSGFAEAFGMNAVAKSEDNPKAYKEYLHVMIQEIKEVNAHLKAVEENTKAIRTKMGV